MTQPQPQPDRILATIWRMRLDNAKESYDLAAAEFHRSAEDYRLREVPDADAALQRAMAAADMARENYMQVLKSFTDLVMSGTLPPSGD